jgi:hypothetical protein
MLKRTNWIENITEFCAIYLKIQHEIALFLKYCIIIIYQ